MEPTIQILTAFEQIKIDGINCVSLDQHHRDVVYIGWNTYLHVFIKYIAPLYNLWYQSFVKSSVSMINIGFLFRINNTTIIVNRGHSNKNEIKQNNNQVMGLLQPAKYDELYDILLKLLLNLKNNNFDEKSILTLLRQFVSDEEEKKLNPDAVPFVPTNTSSTCSSLAPYVSNRLRNKAQKQLQTIQEHAIAIYDSNTSINNLNIDTIPTNTLQSLFPILLNAKDVYELSLIPVVITRRTRFETTLAFDNNSLGALRSMVMNSNNRNRFRFNDDNLIVPTAKMITSSQPTIEELKDNNQELKQNDKIIKNKKTQKNKKNNNRKKKQRTKKRNMKLAQNKSDYYPSQVNEIIGNIIKTISKKMTTVIIPSKVIGIKKDWYKYMRKLTVMHFNDNPNSINDKIFAINYGIYDNKNNEEYYHIIENGKMIDELFTKQNILDMKIKSYKSPVNKFIEQLNWDIDGIITYLTDDTNSNNIKKMISINWCHVNKFIKKNNKQRMIYQITNEEFKKKINYEIKNEKICKKDFLPIIMFRNDKHWVEWIWKFKIEQDVIIGISLKYEENNGKRVLKVISIHLDINSVLEQHELFGIIGYNKKELNDWKLYKNINNIQISGNLDDDKNRFKAHCKNQVDMWQYVINAMNSGEVVDIKKLQSYKKNAQDMLEQL